MKRMMLFIMSCIFFYNINAQVSLSRKSSVRELEKEYVSGLFKSDNAYVIVPEDDPAALSAFTIFHYLQGRVPGLMININPFRLEPSISYRSARPAFFLDEVRVDAVLLANINVNDIVLVKVFRPPFIGAFGGGSGGAIAVYTKKGEEDEE